jgi:hypothetical protein
MAGAFTVVDPPGVEHVVSPLDADSAEAGRQVKYRCTLPDDVGPDGIRRRTGTGTFQNTASGARASAIRNTLSRGWTATLIDGDWHIMDGDGFGYITDADNISCVLHDSRTVRDKKKPR